MQPSTHKLSVWRTLGHALRAPFGIGAASCKAVSKPFLAVIVSSLLLVAINHLQWNVAAVWLVLLSLWLTLAWLALEFQRHLLLGATACEADPLPWRRYSLHLIAVLAVCTLLAVFVGLLLQFVLPAVVFFAMAINSPDPWIAMGTVLLPTLVAVVAAYPMVRLCLILPALSVGHVVAPKRIWRITRGNGLRLLALLVLIPGVVAGFFAIGQPPGVSGPWLMWFITLLNAYLYFVYLSILAIAYQALSDQALPRPARSSAGYGRLFYTRVLRPLGLVVLVGIGLAAGWDSFYRVTPGENVMVSRLGNPERVESDAGIQLKVPFIEDVEPISETAIHVTKGEGAFLTVDKKSLPLRYEFQWHVSDGNIFARALAGRTRHADRRIQEVANSTLRNEVLRLSPQDVGFLRDAGKVKFFMGKGLHNEIMLSSVLPDINKRIAVMGVEISEWQVEMTDALN